MTALPEVAAAAVVAVPHPRWEERPIVVVTLEEDAATDGLLQRVHQPLGGQSEEIYA